MPLGEDTAHRVPYPSDWTQDFDTLVCVADQWHWVKRAGLAAETLALGQTAVVTAEFAPKTAGSISGRITITSNASNGSIVVPVTGTA